MQDRLFCYCNNVVLMCIGLRANRECGCCCEFVCCYLSRTVGNTTSNYSSHRQFPNSSDQPIIGQLTHHQCFACEQSYPAFHGKHSVVRLVPQPNYRATECIAALLQTAGRKTV